MMTKTIQITVIIPTYNYAALLPRAVNSVLSQLPPDGEVIVLDDGSTDDTQEVVKQWANHPQVLLIHQQNSGLACTRNNGMELARGTYCMFLDADDELEPGALPAVLEKLSGCGRDFIIAGHISYDDLKQTARRCSPPEKIPDEPEKRFFLYLDKKIKLQSGPVIFRTEVAKRIGFPAHLRCTEDLPFYARLMLECKPEICDIPLARIHHHPGSMRRDFEKQRLYNVQANEEVFNPVWLPPHLMQWKTLYLARRRLSLSRILFKAGLPSEGREEYIRAVKTSPAALANIGMLRRFCLSYFIKLPAQQGRSLTRQPI